MEYRKPGSKQVYYELSEKIPEEAIPKEKPTDPLLLDIWNGFYKGAGEVVGDAIETVGTMINPKTYFMIGYKGAEYVDHFFSSPEATVHKSIDMAKYMCQSVKNAFERDVVHGDAESRTEFFTQGLGTIGVSLFGDKGISKLSTAAKTVNAGKTGQLKVNTGVAPALEVAGTITTYKIPYNVLHHCKDNILKLVEEQFSTVKYGEHYIKVNRKKTLKPNVQYTTSHGYKYTTDELGRIIDVEAKLELGSAKRNTYAQRTVGGDDRLENDDGGHLIASIFDGSGEIDNLVPMDARINRSEYKIIEGRWKKALLEGKRVKVNIKPLYKGSQCVLLNLK